MKKIAVLGSTGSVGVNALKVIEALSSDYKVEALCTYNNTKLLAEQIRRFKPGAVAVINNNKVSDLKNRISLKNIKVFSTLIGAEMLAESRDIDIVVIAISGSSALNPLIAAIKAGKKICLANKESIVMAGNIIMNLAKRYKATVIPVDSEHSAIFQCLRQNNSAKFLKKIYLTGTGGPLKDIPKKKFKNLKRSEILRHPKWNMGRKITVDSATMMNKGLEVIEAKHLFNISSNRIKILIHPEAIVHSMVELNDGSVFAHLGPTDMKLPIQYALTFPERVDAPFETLDFLKIRNLTFSPPQTDKFPCLELANVACKLSGTYPAVLNASDEIAVNAYLKGSISFNEIPKIIEKVMLNHKSTAEPMLSDILVADAYAREESKRIILK